jgi:hypothetical protein
MKGSRNTAQAGIGQVREHSQPEKKVHIINKEIEGRWVAKMVARLLATAALEFEFRHISKIQKWAK